MILLMCRLDGERECVEIGRRPVAFAVPFIYLQKSRNRAAGRGMTNRLNVAVYRKPLNDPRDSWAAAMGWG
jgi:hypothetical protein